MGNGKILCHLPAGIGVGRGDELRKLGADKVGGGVRFAGELFLCYRVNLESRLASRILWQVVEGREVVRD